MAPACVSELMAIAAAEAISARRMIKLLSTPPAEWAGEPPSKTAQVRFRRLKRNRVLVITRGRAPVREPVIQMRNGTTHVRSIDLEPDTKDGCSGISTSFVEDTFPHPPSCIDNEALLNADLLSMRSPPATAVTAHFMILRNDQWTNTIFSRGS
jgi:hypothetical protein